MHVERICSLISPNTYRAEIQYSKVQRLNRSDSQGLLKQVAAPVFLTVNCGITLDSQWLTCLPPQRIISVLYGIPGEVTEWDRLAGLPLTSCADTEPPPQLYHSVLLFILQ